MGRNLWAWIGAWVVAALAIPAGAQTTPPPPHATSAYTTAPTAGDQGTNTNVTKPPPVPLSAMVQRNGGSLARAEFASTIDPVPFSSISYTAVPEQKPKLLRKHDLVTIVVREDSQFSSNGTTTEKRSADLDAVIDSYVTLSLQQAGLIEHSPSTPIELKTNGTRDFDGEGTVNRADSFTANITAEVVDVKPNGTLVLEAKQTITTDEETQQMKLTGTCRVEDVTADNTVLSNQLFDLSLDKQHTGAVRDSTTRGFIPRLLDKLNPF